jgi:hypothetical protein
VLFSTPEECCAQLVAVLHGFPGSGSTLLALRNGLRDVARPTWGQAWISDVRPALLRATGKN